MAGQRRDDLPDRALPFSIFDSSAGTGFLGQGSTPLLGASLAPGASIASGLSSGNIHSRVLNGYLNPTAFTPAPQLYPTQCAFRSELLHDRVRRSGTQYLPRAVPAELGCFVPQVFQDWRASGSPFRGGLLQHVESHQFWRSDGDGYRSVSGESDEQSVWKDRADQR